ncbi:hypothetical protein [Vibrio sonorensis]|nr:hypothetical protein [Vibrio sonorensis]
MTINKYFVLVPKAISNQPNPKSKSINQRETQRQKLVKQAQQQGGIA